MPSSKLSNKQKRSAVAKQRSTVFEAIGTGWSITIDQNLTETTYDELIKSIKKRIARFDKDYSRFRPDSLVTRIAERPGHYKLPSDGESLFDLYKELYDISGGLVTPLIGRLMSDAGYDAEYSLTPSTLSSVPSWEETMEYKFPDVITKAPVLLDVGAAGKGYLVDIVAELIKRQGINNFCINAGGDIVQSESSGEPTSIGLEHPLRPDEVIGVVKLANKSICGSSGNRRTWKNFHHIINPKTKSSPTGILAAWVVADSALLADGLATALFFVRAPKLQMQYDFEYALVRNDLSLEHSDNFPAEFFTTNKAAYSL